MLSTLLGKVRRLKPSSIHTTVKQAGSQWRQRGASLVEFVVIAPIVIAMILGIMQVGLVFFAKSNVNYATFMAARAGSMNNALVWPMRDAFVDAMVGYYGRSFSNSAEFITARDSILNDEVNRLKFRIEILSPTHASFDDYNSPSLQGASPEREIPNNNLNAITCPVDNPVCNNDPLTNTSKQTLSDANLLKIRVTYGIAPNKQMPVISHLIPAFYNLLGGSADPYIQDLIDGNYIPIVAHTTVRMQSNAKEDMAIPSNMK